VFRAAWLYPFVSLKKTMDSPGIVLRVFGIPIYRQAKGEEAEPPAEKKKPARVEPEKKQKPEKRRTAEEKRETEEKQKTGKKQRDKAKKSGSLRRADKGARASGKTKSKAKKHFSFETLSGIIRFVGEEETKHAVKTLKKELTALFRYLSPQKIEGEFLVGTGEPALTGLLFGAISLVPVVYQKDLQLTPDFEEKTFLGKGKMKGRTRVFYFVRLVIRLYRDDMLRRVWSRVNN
jgi:hypothetical protein